MMVIVIGVGGGTAFRRGDGRQDDERAVVGDVEVQPAAAGRNPGDDRPAAVAAAEDEVAGRFAWRGAGERKCETR